VLTLVQDLPFPVHALAAHASTRLIAAAQSDGAVRVLDSRMKGDVCAFTNTHLLIASIHSLVSLTRPQSLLRVSLLASLTGGCRRVCGQVCSVSKHPVEQRRRMVPKLGAHFRFVHLRRPRARVGHARPQPPPDDCRPPRQGTDGLASCALSRLLIAHTGPVPRLAHPVAHRLRRRRHDRRLPRHPVTPVKHLSRQSLRSLPPTFSGGGISRGACGSSCSCRRASCHLPRPSPTTRVIIIIIIIIIMQRRHPHLHRHRRLLGSSSTTTTITTTTFTVP
jgi:hypothetical protein